MDVTEDPPMARYERKKMEMQYFRKVIVQDAVRWGDTVWIAYCIMITILHRVDDWH